MTRIVKQPQQVNTTVDPGLQNIYNREKESFYNPANEVTGTVNNVIIQEVTQVLTTVIQNKAPYGSNGEIQFNEGGDFAGDLQLTYDPISDTLTTGTIVIDGIIATRNGIVNLGEVQKLKVYGGNYNQVLRTDGNGTLTFTSILPDTANNQGKSLTVDGNSYIWKQVEYGDLANVPNFATTSYVTSAIGNLINGAPAALDTLKELATALANDASYATTISTSLANKANTIELSTVAFTGSYINLTNKPQISQVGYTGRYSDLTGAPNPDLFATTSDVGNIANNLSNVSNDLNNLRNTANNLTGNVGNLSNNVSNLANDVSGLNSDLGNLSDTVRGFGNITSINLNGNANTVLRGDGTFGVGGPGNVSFIDVVNVFGTLFKIDPPSNANLQLADSKFLNSTGNFEIGTGNFEDGGSNYIWRFDNSGNMSVPGKISTPGNLTVGGETELYGNVTVYNDLQVNGNINFTGEVTQVSGQSGQFFGDANGVGALYAGIPAGYASVYNPIIQASASSNDYTQINFQNINNGNLASADYVLTTDDGSDTQGYMDMGITSSSWDGTQLNSVGNAAGARDGYLYVRGGLGGGNLILGTATEGTKVKFMVEGPASDNIVATIDSNGISATHIAGEGGNLSNIQGSNVSGQVSFAAVANSVNVANVVGLGNISTINLDGNASTILYGNGVFATAPTSGGNYGDSNVSALLSNYTGNITTTETVQAGNLAAVGNIYLYGPGVAGTISVGSIMTTGSIRIGGPSQTGNLTFGRSTQSSNTFIQSGNILSGETRYINIGVNGLAGSNTVINMGSDVPGSLGNITFGNTTQVKIGNSLVVTGNITANNIGNISAVNLNNNASHVLYGNGVFATAPATYTNTNVASFLASAFGTNTITTTGNISAGNANLGNLAVAGYFSGDGSLLSNINTANISGNIQGTSANLTLTAGSYSTTFDNTGNMVLPYAANVYINGAFTNGNIVINPPGSGDVIITKQLSVLDTSYSISSTTGSFQTLGGVGVGGAIYANGSISTNSALLANPSGDSVSPTVSLDKLYWFDDGANYNAGIQKRNGSMGGIFFRANSLSTNFSIYSSNAYNKTGANDVAVFNVTTAGNTTLGNIANGATYTSSGQLVVNGGNTAEGAQITLGWPTVNNLTGQANSTWNMDVDASNNYRLFSQNATGSIGIVMTSNALTGTTTFGGNISGNTGGYAIGYRDIPQIAASNATLGLSDAGKHYYSTTAGNLTLTIPNNATTSFSTGTAITIIVQATGNILVNAGTGVTLYMAGNSTAANRIVGSYGMATLMKVGTDTWFINGTGVV